MSHPDLLRGAARLHRVTPSASDTAIPDPRVKPTLTVAEAGSLLGLCRSRAYEEARRFLSSSGAEGLPTLAFGRCLRCPTARVVALLGLDYSERRAG
jgi:hypothetical protein